MWTFAYSPGCGVRRQTVLRGRAMLAPTGRTGVLAHVRRGASPFGVMRHYGRLRIRRGAA